VSEASTGDAGNASGRPQVPAEGGLLLLDKPVGLSSNAALQRVRHAYGGLKAGHTGTLDPLASGMLPICLGEATKVAGEVLAGRKCYRFGLKLGERRSTGDAEGEVVATAPVPPLDPDRVQAALTEFIGTTRQVPPMYSALKRDGQPLYKLARAGQTVEREAREVTIERLDLLDQGPDWLDCRVLCSKGTYVRVLGEDLARRLGSEGFLQSLRREYVEPFQALPMVSLEAVLAGPLPPLLAADAALPHLAVASLDPLACGALRHGQAVLLPPSTSGTAGSLVRLHDPSGRFFGLGEVTPDGRLRPRRLYATAPDGSPAT
jgi:tRNA pseudouridine55 synthase